MSGRVAEMPEERKEVRRAPRTANLTGEVTRTEETLETKAKAKARARARARAKPESETRDGYDCGEQGHIGANCPYKWTNSTDEEEDQGSLWENEDGREEAEELASLEAPDGEGEWC